MFGNAFGWPHLIVILVVILLLFGAPKLPGLAKSLGQSMRIFRKEVSTLKEEKAADDFRSTSVQDEATGAGLPAADGRHPRPGDSSSSTDSSSSPAGSSTSQPKP